MAAPVPPSTTGARTGARLRRLAAWTGCLMVAVPLAILHATLLAVASLPAPAAYIEASAEALVITDRRGGVLATLATTPGRSSDAAWLPIEQVPPLALAMVVHSEDASFWQHGGVDSKGVARAAWLNAQAGRIAFGGSTLTMQVARMMISPGQARTLRNKAAEVLLALRLERALSKRDILEQWFNRAYFGNGAFGFAAAAKLYFGKVPAMLAPAEAALLAVLPRAPQRYSPLASASLALALTRRDYVLGRLRASNAIDHTQLISANAPVAVSRHRDEATLAPHFVAWIVEQLPPQLRWRGGTITTTLDVGLQTRLQGALAARLDAASEFGVRQAGLVVLDTATGQILAMVGSRDWQGEDGQLNIATRRRNPGSALKPFIYAAAIERGDTPFSVAYDIRDVSPDYIVPTAGRDHGPSLYREALAGSYNFAAVDVLERTGIATVMSLLKRAGVAELAGTPKDYGLRLALGSAKVRLVDLVAGYGFLVRGGVARGATGILRAEQLARHRVWKPPPVLDQRVVSEQTAWLVMSMLSDKTARGRVFGRENPFDLPFDVAAKTGTMRGFADTVAVAATQQVLVGAWAGNFDGQPSNGALAMDVAAPLVREALLAIAASKPLTLPPRPADIVAVEVCAVSGMKPGPACPHLRDWAPRDRQPTHECDWHDPATGSLRYPPRAAQWAKSRPAELPTTSSSAPHTR